MEINNVKNSRRSNKSSVITEMEVNKNVGIYMNEIIKDINKYNIIEGIINIKDDLLFNSEEEIEVEVYINNKKVKVIKEENK